jgi:hypothetical protein
MPAIFDLLYREYCLARLAEMRKQLLLRPGSHEIPEAKCDFGDLDRATDRDSGLGPLQHEAGHGRPS